MRTPSAAVLRDIDLICDRFEQSWPAGPPPPIEGLTEAFDPTWRGLLEAELIQLELEWRCRLGMQPAAAEYVVRFPAHAAALDGWLTDARAAASAALAGTETGLFRPTLSHSTPRPTAAPSPDAPRVLGEYELLERLGAGGMGVVWKARHRRLGRLLAVKLLPCRPDLSPQAVERFLREMRALGQLEHPNVVEATDAGQHGDTVYLAMKLIEGEDLHRRVRRCGPLSVADACALARQIADALAYLHGRNLVHRDLKPSNVMLSSEGVVKLLDLGLARWLGEGAAGDCTSPGQVMGTADYMAPEQGRDAASVDGRADLYALGATLFFLLTGKPPFAHHSGMLDKMRAHAEEPPPDVRALRPEVPPAVAEMVARLLAKQPADRPATAEEAATALTAPGRAGSVMTPVTPPSASSLPWSLLTPLAVCRHGRHRRLVLAGATAAALLTGLLVWGVAQSTDRSETPSEPERAAVGDSVHVTRLSVRHFARVRGGVQPRGILGEGALTTRTGDGVTVEARLSEPAYAFLISFRPDGTDEVLFPEDKDQPPERTERPSYPSVSRGTEVALEEGTGLQVVALVVSRRPLPAYAQWRQRLGQSPWRRVAAVPGVVWEDDGTAQLPRTRGPGRGKGREMTGAASLARLTGWLKRAPQVTAVAAVGFPVLADE